MGISLEQYRSSVGSFNRIRTKQTGFKNTQGSESRNQSSYDQNPAFNQKTFPSKSQTYGLTMGPWKISKMIIFSLIIILSLPVPIFSSSVLSNSVPSNSALALPLHQPNGIIFDSTSPFEHALPELEENHDDLSQVIDLMIVWPPINEPGMPCLVFHSSCVCTLYPTLFASETALPFQCQQLLLIISGIESNPGPMSSEDILADLCTNAPTTEIRDCLRTYILNSTSTDALHKHIVSKNNRSAIENTVRHLCNPMRGQFYDLKTEDYTVRGLAFLLIYRIENLLPETCQHCKEEYCVNTTDIPLLSCSVCGQGAHTPCVFRTLLVEEKDRGGFTPEMALQKINPLMLPELKYLCKDCTEEYLPDKNDGLKKCAAERRQNSEQTNGTGSDTEDVPDGDARGEPQHDGASYQQDGSNTASGGGLFGTNGTQTHEPPTRTPADDDTQAEADNPRPRNGNLHPRIDNHLNNNNHPPDNICPFYTKGTCRYGISGRQCPKNHPKACQKLLQNGTRYPNGCSLGSSCDKFHPLMCISSLRTRTCYNMDCKRAHVKGTKRLRPTSHIPRLLDMRFNQQNHDRIQSAQSHNQNHTQHGQYHEGRRQEHDQRHTVMSQSNNNHQQYNHQGPRQQEHDQRCTVQSQPNNNHLQYNHANQDYEHSSPNNQRNFLEETLHSLNIMNQELRMQFQQTLNQFRTEMIGEMNLRLAPYPPLSRNHGEQASGNHGEQASEGQYPSHRGEHPQYIQQYWNPAQH